MYPQTRSTRARASSSSAAYSSGKNSSVGKTTATSRKASLPNSSSNHAIDSSSQSLSSSSTGHFGVDQNIECGRFRGLYLERSADELTQTQHHSQMFIAPGY